MEEIKLFVPGRIALIGEMSDLVSPYLSKNKDLVPGSAIAVKLDKGIYSKVKKADKFIYKSKEHNFECEMLVDRLKEEAENNSFFSYMCGTILYIFENHLVSGIEIEIEKMDLPMNKGLSSSAAICMTIAKAYNKLYNLKLTDEDIKNIAYQGEHLAQSECGKLDQESIANDSISHIIFEENVVKSQGIFVKENVYLLIVDLNSSKDTKSIMTCFNDAFPIAKNENQKLIQNVIGTKNKKLVDLTIQSLKEGNIKQIGETLTEVQNSMDKIAEFCKELKAPTLHKILDDEKIKEKIYGGKSSGSGGDGTAVLICKNEENQEELKKYIKEQYNMDSIKFCVEKTKKDVVIAGAGPAGLTVGYCLLKNSPNYNITILEKDSQVGGISKTVDFNGNKVDTGIHRFFTLNEEVEQIWEEILPIQSKPAYDDIILNRERVFPEVGSDPEVDEKCMLVKDRVTRIYYGKKFYNYPVTLNFTTMKNMGFLTLLKAGFSYIKACIFKKPETSLENFYINRFGNVLYKMFFKSYTEKVWGISPSEISADWGAQRVKGVSITAVLKDAIKKLLGTKNKENTETSLIEQFIYPKLGAGQIYEEMAKEIEKMGGKVILNANVKELYTENKNITKVVYENDGKLKEINSDIFISSIPIKELVQDLKEEVPQDVYDIATNLPYRDFMSVVLLTDRIDLKNNTKMKTVQNIVPDSWIYIQEPDVKLGRVQIFNNWSPYIFKNKEDIDKNFVVALEYFCSEDDEYWNMPEEKFIEFAKEEAEKIGLTEIKDVRDAMRIKIPKAYPAYFGVYKEIDKVIEFLNSHDNLYCIGRNGQHRYNNMDHSMLTGIVTARTIINNPKEKEKIWNVNTEKKYQETKF